jgi:hypothetical protein
MLSRIPTCTSLTVVPCEERSNDAQRAASFLQSNVWKMISVMLSVQVACAWGDSQHGTGMVRHEA